MSGIVTQAAGRIMPASTATDWMNKGIFQGRPFVICHCKINSVLNSTKEIEDSVEELMFFCAIHSYCSFFYLPSLTVSYVFSYCLLPIALAYNSAQGLGIDYCYCLLSTMIIPVAYCLLLLLWVIAIAIGQGLGMTYCYCKSYEAHIMVYVIV